MQTTICILEICWDNENMETTKVHWGYIGILENKMETTIMRLYRV